MQGLPEFWHYLHRRYSISKLGIKIAAVIGIGLLFDATLELNGHYVASLPGNEFINHYFWITPVIVFFAIMAVLSVLVIMPIKKFEMHIRKIQEGRHAGPLVLNRNDEIGYLADRFSSLHKAITEKIELKDMELDVLHSFMGKAAGLVDIEALMSCLFSEAKSLIKFDVAAFFVSHKGRTQAMIFVSKGIESQAHGLMRGFFDRSRQDYQDIADTAAKVCPEVKTLWDIEERSPQPGTLSVARLVEFPLMCWGHNVGRVSFVTLDGQEVPHDSRLIKSMLNFAGTVLERMLASISREERRLSTILSSMEEGVYVINRNGTTTSINPKGVELLSRFCNDGVECLKGGMKQGLLSCPQKTMYRGESCKFEQFVDKVRTDGLGGKNRSEEVIGEGGTVMLVNAGVLSAEGGAEDGYVITARDMTNDRKIQQKIFLSSKLVALGEMAAGIAHEINNPLQAILLNIDLVAENGAQKPFYRLAKMRDSINRIRCIVKDLLVFAREQTTENEAADINELVTRCEHMLANQFRLSNITIEPRLYGEGLPVLCNKNLFEQVVINLLNNSRDAIIDSGKGSLICIETGRAGSGLAFMRVWDDGPGIRTDVIERVFDPFFTTKDVGKGTGLGLSLSRKIIENTGGSIHVESRLAGGAVFTVELPLYTREAEPKHRTREKQGPMLPDYSFLTGKAVLMLEDEEDIASSISAVLSRKADSFHSAGNGNEGLEKIMDHDYDFILLDIKMPEMDGFEFYKKVSEIKPYLSERIIFLTGDTESERTKSFLKLSGNRYLSKPFDVRELVEAMRDDDGDYGGREGIQGHA